MANLTKSLTHGLLAAASVGAVLTLSEAAQAQSFTVGNFQSNPAFNFTVDDKLFSDFSITGTTVDPQDEITISFTSGIYQVNYSAGPGSNFALTTPGTLNYKVTILPGFSNEFAFAGTNAQGNTIGSVFGKTLGATGLTPNPLNFVSTGATVTGNFAPGLKTIDVTSSWSLISGANPFINGFSDQFTQNPVNPDPIPTPEPSTILGMGMLLLGALPVFKRKSVKK